MCINGVCVYLVGRNYVKNPCCTVYTDPSRSWGFLFILRLSGGCVLGCGVCRSSVICSVLVSMFSVRAECAYFGHQCSYVSSVHALFINWPLCICIAHFGQQGIYFAVGMQVLCLHLWVFYRPRSKPQG